MKICAPRTLGKRLHSRLIPRRAGWLRSTSSAKTSETQLVVSEQDENTGIASMTMSRPPANSLSLEMLQAISNSLKELEDKSNVQGLILKSSSSKIFSAGLDLSELHQPDLDRLPQFWNAFQQLYIDLYGSRLTTVAAIDGHAIAGGCMLALSCDYRMVGYGEDSAPFKIGLNETRLGILAPPWLAQQYVDTIGRRSSELALSQGRLFSPQQALELGLIDSIVETQPNAASLHSSATDYLQKWISNIPAEARYGTKKWIRQERINRLLATREQDTEDFCSFVTQDSVQASLGAYLQSMSKRK